MILRFNNFLIFMITAGALQFASVASQASAENSPKTTAKTSTEENSLQAKSSRPPKSSAKNCGDRLKAFNIYEDLIKGRIVSKHSIFKPGDWSDSQAYQGLLIAGSESKDLTLIFEVPAAKNSKSVQVKTFKFTTWKEDSKYLVAEGFDPDDHMPAEPIEFALSLKQNDKVLCRSVNSVLPTH